MDQRQLRIIVLLGAFVLGASGYFSPQVLASALPAEQQISIQELRQLQIDKKDFLLLDARDKKTYDKTHIEGAVLSLPEDFYKAQELFQMGIAPTMPDPVPGLSEKMKGISHDFPIVTYCNANCNASATLLRRLKDLGFTNVRSMEEGLQAWEKAGHPVVRGKE